MKVAAGYTMYYRFDGSTKWVSSQWSLRPNHQIEFSGGTRDPVGIGKKHKPRTVSDNVGDPGIWCAVRINPASSPRRNARCPRWESNPHTLASSGP